MNVKIQCACGTKFSFDVIPAQGRMPMNVNCPGCNTSALDLANAEIARQLAASPSTPQIAVAQPVAPQPAPAPAPSSTAAPQRASMPAVRMTVPQPAPTPAPAAPAASAPAPARAPAPVSKVPQVPASGGLRISHSPSAAPVPVAAPVAAPTEAAPAQTCPKHKNQTTTEVCCVCGKPICIRCMEQFGYVCSVYCRSQATAKKIYVPACPHQKVMVQGQSSLKIKRIVFASIAALILGTSAWVWYTYFAREPKVVYSVEIPQSESRFAEYKPDEYYGLVGPGLLLSVKSKKMMLYDIPRKTNVWTTRLQSETEEAAFKIAKESNDKILAEAAKNGESEGRFLSRHGKALDPVGELDDTFFSHPQVVPTTNDLWVILPDRLLRLDRQTGASKPLPLTDKVQSIRHRDNTILVVTSDNSGREVLTQITLPDGTSQNEEIRPGKAVAAAKPGTKPGALAVRPATGVPAVAKNARPTPASTDKPVIAGTKLPVDRLKKAAVQASAAKTPTDEDQVAADMEDYFLDRVENFIPTGPNVVQFSSKMIEHKTIEHEGMKAKTKPSVIDSDHLTAGKSMEASRDFLNDQTRDQTGGKEVEDVSRYQVTLHRRMGTTVADWTGEVTSMPSFVALKTVDVVAAGNTIYVFDKNNKKLWDAKLTYKVTHGYFDEEGGGSYYESKDSLYVADQGMLSKFDLATGTPGWRINTVGVRRIQEDARGKLYVSTTSAGPDSIQYALQYNPHDKVHPVILKVDEKTGKVIWRAMSVGDHTMLTGKFVYATMVTQTMALLHLEDGPDTNYNLNLLDPSSGGVIWNYYVGNHQIVRTDVQEKWAMMQFRDKLIVLKFFSL